jgi:hypothetical protein
LSLSDIQLEMDLTKVDALYELKGRILRLTANGPAEYKGPKFMFDSLRDALKGEMWAVGPIVDCEVKSLSINDAVGFLVNNLRTARSMGGDVYQGRPSEKPTIPIAAMKADAIHYGKHRATPRYPQRRHSTGGNQYPRRGNRARLPEGNRAAENSSTQVPQGEDLAKLLREKRCLRCGKQGHFIARCYADVEKSHTQALKTYLAEGNPMEELLVFAGAELDAFHVQDQEDEPAIQEDDEEKIMMAGLYNSFWNGDAQQAAADDADF